MAVAGRATAQGTARYAARLVTAGITPREHFREALGLTLSSIGYGTALGAPADDVDAHYRAAVAEAVRAGCNVLDTAASYRMDRSEIALGRAVADLLAAGECLRDELVITSKGGFVVYHHSMPAADSVQYVYERFIKPGIFEPDDLAGGIHCMAPNFLSQQVAWSLRDTGLRGLDIYYIQNPETQLAFEDRATFRRRLQLAFARLEEEVAAGRIGCYGVATWEALRRSPMANDYMSLEIMLRLAVEVAGPGHHLRAVQLPASVTMIEAATLRNQPVKSRILTALDAARDLGLSVFASAALGQGQLSERAAELLDGAFPKLTGQTQRALQFARSLPGVASALFGSTQIEHVRQNLRLAAQPPDSKRALRIARGLAR